MKSVQKITSKICQPNDCALLKESNKDKKIPIYSGVPNISVGGNKCVGRKILKKIINM